MALRLWNWLPWRLTRRLYQRVLFEDALKWLFSREYENEPADLGGLAAALGVRRARARALLARLSQLGLVEADTSNQLRLTRQGQENAARIVRVHRLVETYLAEESGLPRHDWHGVADRLEHAADDAEVERLARRLGHPRFDPHGDPIPTAAGEVVPPRGAALSQLETGVTGRIVHIEDEPREVYQQLVDRGFEIGRHVVIRSREEQGSVVELDGHRMELSPAEVENISARRLPPETPAPPTTIALARLPVGQQAVVRDIAPSCTGLQRRRLLDLGFVPGTRVAAEFASPSGDPVAYRVRGTLIALRSDQAQLIRIESPETHQTTQAGSAQAT